MLKRTIYALLILANCILAASCLATRQNEISKNASTSDAKKAETKNDRAELKSSDSPKDEQTIDTKNQALNDLEKDESTDSLDTSTKNGFELRCGWYSNPTPGNHWLEDKDGEWIIGVQGGYQAEGDAYPEFQPNQWVETNGSYGYGCACLSVKVDRKEGLVLEIKSAKARPLSACRNDPALKEPRDE